jgi:hypothetical protein
MNRKTSYIILILIVVAALFLFYRLGESSRNNSDAVPENLSNYPTSTPRPQIFRFIQEALKRNPKPTPPKENYS